MAHAWFRPLKMAQHRSGTRLWVTGIKIAWEQLYTGEQRQRVALPTYPFERQRLWLSVPARQQPRAADQPAGDQRIFIPLWKQSVPLPTATALPERRNVLLFCESEVSFTLARYLTSLNYEVICVARNEDFSSLATNTTGTTCRMRAGYREDFDQLIQELHARHIRIDKVVHMWIHHNHLSAFSIGEDARNPATFTNMLGRPWGDYNNTPPVLLCKLTKTRTT